MTCRVWYIGWVQKWQNSGNPDCHKQRGHQMIKPKAPPWYIDNCLSYLCKPHASMREPHCKNNKSHTKEDIVHWRNVTPATRVIFRIAFDQKEVLPSKSWGNRCGASLLLTDWVNESRLGRVLTWTFEPYIRQNSMCIANSALWYTWLIPALSGWPRLILSLRTLKMNVDTLEPPLSVSTRGRQSIHKYAYRVTIHATILDIHSHSHVISAICTF
jgi:hypothetical protein